MCVLHVTSQSSFNVLIQFWFAFRKYSFSACYSCLVLWAASFEEWKGRTSASGMEQNMTCPCNSSPSIHDPDMQQAVSQLILHSAFPPRAQNAMLTDMQRESITASQNSYYASSSVIKQWLWVLGSYLSKDLPSLGQILSQSDLMHNLGVLLDSWLQIKESLCIALCYAPVAPFLDQEALLSITHALRHLPDGLL